VEASVSAGEETWIRRAQAGEREALAWLVGHYGPRVQRLLVRVFGPRQDLEDLVQNTFLELLGALPRCRHDSSFSTFLTGIAVRVGRRALRPRLVERKAVALGASEHVASDAPSLERHAQTAETLRRVHLLLSEVAEPKRVAFSLWALEGLSPAEIAEVMDASLPATRSRIFYAQKELMAAAARDPYVREWLEERVS
jgi:RNA polymerase sigma-70 factor (ECF subfamily)